MEPRSLQYVAEKMAGRIVRMPAAGATVARISTDSRTVQAGDLFLALRGDRFDGHDYVAAAAAAGARAAIVESSWPPENVGGMGLVSVEDTRRALAKLATGYRSEFDLLVIGVAGSNGKTTTKELVAAVLRQKFATLWSESSFNNEIGVPLTLLKIEQNHRVAVLELGTNHPGELATLIGFARPNYGVITNIGHEHLEFFGDLNGVAREEGQLAEHLPPGGKLFLNGDSPWTPELIRRSQAQVIRVGFNPGNDWRATEIQVSGAGTVFTAEGPRPEHSGRYEIRLLGRHQVLNALFALAVGSDLGVSREELREGLADCHPIKMRLQFCETQGVQILDDSYNANLDSVLAALQTLKDVAVSGRRVAVLGEMAELGEQSVASHEEAGRAAAELGIDLLVAVGRMSKVMARAARAAGMSQVKECDDVGAAVEFLRSRVKSDDLVLVKASRSARLERVTEAFKAEGCAL
jgi:UDP-N-acetylmuramoyl-tripeptide--D-alanyl-D-alanine ligase